MYPCVFNYNCGIEIAPLSGTVKRILLLAAAVILSAADDPLVPLNSVLISKVRRGDLIVNVDGYGKLSKRAEAFEGIVNLPPGSPEVRAGNPVLIDVRTGLFHGAVKSIEVDGAQKHAIVGIEGSTARLAAGESIAASIQVDKLENVLTLERVGLVNANQHLALYRVSGDAADRVNVQTGRTNGKQVEIREGLSEGDRVIVTRINVPRDQPRVKLQ
jgi:hypothetical protein